MRMDASARVLFPHLMPAGLNISVTSRAVCGEMHSRQVRMIRLNIHDQSCLEYSITDSA